MLMIVSIEHTSPRMYITGRSLYKRFLFAWFRFNTTWKFTPLFEFTQ